MAGSIAAPVLAGFSFTLIGLIVPKTDDVKWPGLALALLMAAAVAFIAAVQFAFTARVWVVRPADLAEWRPHYRLRNRVAYQWLHREAFRRWFRRFQTAYRIGILALFAGVGVLLVPPEGLDDIGAFRLAAIVVAGVALVGEALWIMSNWILGDSSGALFKGLVDDPPKGANWIQRRHVLRCFARIFVPIAWVDPPPEESEATAEGGALPVDVAAVPGWRDVGLGAAAGALLTLAVVLGISRADRR
ncbi:MAG TPA: hypothetical protein VE596_16555 [Gaiellaceae bacterium]|jgi:hypothetical protein|nr:hypothetical protein [Gaiellaceae bacterium]